MPLSLLAKDSIQDLASLARQPLQAEAESSPTTVVEGQESVTTVIPVVQEEDELQQEQTDSLSNSNGVRSDERVATATSYLQSNNSAGSSLSPQIEIEEEETEVADNKTPPNDNSAAGDNDGSTKGVEDVVEHAANPQQAQEEADEQSPALPATAAYAGFRNDYYQRYHYGSTQMSPSPKPQQQQTKLHGDEHMDDSDSSYYYHDTYAPTVLGQSSQPFFPKLIFCLFPWMDRPEEQRANNEALDSSPLDSQSYEQQIIPDITTASATTTAASAATLVTPTITDTTDGNNNGKKITSPRADDDECSSGSDALGEKLSAKERQAVLARLGLARPDQEPNQDNDDKKGINSPQDARKGLLNGIPTYDTSPLEENFHGETSKSTKGILKHGSRADLQKVRNTTGSKQGKKDEDSNRRRSLFPSYIASAKSGPSNHVGFAPMARVVTIKSKNDMRPEEKADIWWQKSDYEDFRKTGRIITRAMVEGGSEIWLAQICSTDTQCSDYPVTSTGDKWWHRFGHSRRGLEHVVSVQEGRERQINVRTAIRAVLEEQARQKMYHRVDAEKQRVVSLNYTSWARDLALAAGASDADAVSSEFSAERKSREFYLLKLARNTKSKVSLHHVPGFMQPAVRPPSAGVPTTKPIAKSPRITQPHLLDANTAAQISFRRRKVAPKPEATTEEPPPVVVVKEISEPIKDPKPEDQTHESLAHRAAGFSVEGEKVDMAAVLSGMGAIPQEAPPTPVAT